MTERILAVVVAILTFAIAWVGLQYFEGGRGKSRADRSSTARKTKKTTEREAALAFDVGSTAPEPWFVVRVESVYSLLKDYEYVNRRFADDPTVLRRAEQSLDDYVHEDMPKYMDLARPIGVYLVSDAPAKRREFVLMLPLVDAKAIPAFAQLFKKQAVEDETEPGLYRVRLKKWKDPEEEQEYFIRYGHSYAYVATARDLVAAEALVAPDVVFNFAARGMVSAQLRLAKMPRRVKQSWLHDLESWELLAKEVAVLPGLYYYVKGAQWAAIYRLLRTAAEGCDLWTMHVGIDRSAAELSAEWIFTPRPDSALAGQFAAMTPAKSRLAAVPGSQSIFVMRGNLPLPEDVRWTFAMEMAKRWDLFDKANMAQRSRGTDDDSILRAFTSTMTVAGNFDGAVAARGPDANGKVLYIAGVKVFDAPGIEAAIRQRGRRRSSSPGWRLDVARVGAVGIHLLGEWGTDTSDQGDPARYVAVGAGTVWAATGDGAVDALKEVSAAPAGEVPLFEMALSVSRVHALVDAKQAAQIRQQVFGKAKEPADRLRLTMTAGSTMTWRLALPLDVFKYLDHIKPPKDRARP
jgi:hypothetical protein